jgi:predicted DNA-binding protein
MLEQILFKIDRDVKETFTRFARSEGKSTSQKLRELINDYINDRDISLHVDELWEKIGQDLIVKGKNGERVEKAIRESRSSG